MSSTGMNPPLRVRKQEEPVLRQEVSTAYLLRVIESLSLESPEPVKASIVDHGSSNKVEKSTSYTKVSYCNSKDSPAEFSIPKGKTKKHINEENVINIRASSVPRPRAVLSSPDNDGIFGNWNKRAQETVKSAESAASDYNKRRDMDNLPSTHRAPTSTERSHLNSKTIAYKRTIPTKRQPITLSTHNHPKASIHTATAKQSLQIGIQTPPRENCSETGDSKSYPKIKCSELNQLKPKKKAG